VQNRHGGLTTKKTHDSLLKLAQTQPFSFRAVRHFAVFVVCWP